MRLGTYKNMYHQSWNWLQISCFLISLKRGTEDFRQYPSFLLFSSGSSYKIHVSWCVWARLVLDTGPVGHQAKSTAQPSLIQLWEDFPGSMPIAISLPPSPGLHQLLQRLLLCTLRLFFYFKLCILIMCPTFQKAGCFEIMRCFYRSCYFLFLWISLLTETYWFPEGNCLDFFIASICSHWSHWQTLCLFFKDTKLSQMPSDRDQHMYWTVSKAWGA